MVVLYDSMIHRIGRPDYQTPDAQTVLHQHRVNSVTTIQMIKMIIFSVGAEGCLPTLLQLLLLEAKTL